MVTVVAGCRKTLVGRLFLFRVAWNGSSKCCSHLVGTPFLAL